MPQIERTGAFNHWLRELNDLRAKGIIAARIDRLAAGNTGDAKPVGGGVSELRIDFGPGYRVYFVRRGSAYILLLCGGGKGGQARDIKTALALATTFRSGK